MKRILIVVALLAVLLIAADVIHLEIGQPFLPNLDCSLNYLGKYQGPGGRWFFGYQETGVGCQTQTQYVTDCRLEFYDKLYYGGHEQWIYECVSRQ